MKDSLNDYELLYLIHQKDEESLNLLLKRYHTTIWGIVHSSCPNPMQPGVDKDDCYQEGCIGLMDAIQAFREDKESNFAAFARVCIERQVRSYLRKTRTHSYRILSRAQSLDAPIFEDEDDLTLMDVVAVENHAMDPVYSTHLLWAQDQIPLIKEGLPEDQWHIYHLHALGYSYKEIAQTCRVKEKDVDNTIQKIRRKIRSLFDTE